MQLPVRVTPKLIAAAICFLVGSVVLFRTFVAPPQEAAVVSTAAVVLNTAARQTSPADTGTAMPTQAILAQAGYPAPALPTVVASVATVAPTVFVDLVATATSIPPTTAPPATTSAPTAISSAPSVTPPLTSPTTAVPSPVVATVVPTVVPPTVAVATAQPTAAASPTVATPVPTQLPPSPTTARTATPGATVTATRASAVEPTDTPQRTARVTYRVTTASGNPGNVAVLYDDTGDQMREMVVSLPWTIDVTGVSGATMLLLVTNETPGAFVACEILVDGVSLNSERQQPDEEETSCVVDIE